MSWSTWPTTGTPLPGVVAASAMQPAVMPNAGPAVLQPPAAMQYTPEQWAQMQQQNWQQWAQWQQQYQQWHQQYGAEYQKSINALATTNPPTIMGTNTAVPPPPPNENKPPPPPPPEETIHASSGYSTAPPNQQYTTAPPQNQSRNTFQNVNKRTYNAQGGEYDSGKRQMLDNQGQWSKVAPSPKPSAQWQAAQNPTQNQTHAQKIQNLKEITEAEKKFDKEFAAWEAQFNKWKEQNANHPDKTQFLEYEKKWESWRNSLLERREQMRKKRLTLQASISTSVSSTNLSSQTFSQPPPNSLEGPSQESPDAAVDLFTKPPPTQNNEPLTFKANKSFPGEVMSENEDNGADFLKSSPTTGGIPGLDLVKDGPVLDVLEEVAEQKIDQAEPDQSRGPDFEAISKGINSILGDPKLMDMLSMVSKKQHSSGGNPANVLDQAPPPKPSLNPPVPNFSEPPPQARYHFDQSNQSYDEYSEQHGLNQRETVNNFDDQTRMSFSNGPNEQESGFNVPPPGRQSRFGAHENRNNFGGNFNDNRQSKFGRFNSFDGPSDNRQGKNKYGANVNREGPPFNRNNFNTPDTRYNKNDYNNYNDQNYGSKEGYKHYDRDNYNDDGWNEDEDYDKYHEMFNDGEQHIEVPEGVERVPKAVPHETTMPPPEEEPLFVPELVVDYEHKPLKEPEPEISLEPIRMFDYRHKPVNRIPYPQRPLWLSSTLKNIKQFDPLRAARFGGGISGPNFERDLSFPRDQEDNRFNNDRGFRADSKEKFKELEKGRNYPRDRNRDRFDDSPKGKGFQDRNKDRDRYRDSRSRSKHEQEKDDKAQTEVNKLDLEDLSDDEWSDDGNKETKRGLRFSPSRRNIDSRSPDLTLSANPSNPVNTAVSLNTTLEELINPPGRYSRPLRIVIILRGPPGSGKTYLAKLIKDREVENGGSAPRILSLDDYFMVEQEKEIMEDGKLIKVKEMVYEYEAEMEESYRQSLTRSFRKTITDGYFNFIVVDNVNQKVKNFGALWSFAKQNGFQVYICQLDLDPQLCTRRNKHNRSQTDIEDCIAGWEPTPLHHPLVDATNFLQSCGPIAEVEMEEVDQPEEEKDVGEEDHVRSKWDSFDCSLNNLARLDGVNKPLRSSRTMEEYLQLDDEWQEPSEPTKPGQKRVRWADLEEQKQQKKMKALGFIVGQTDWNRMMDPTSGENALIKTKYIERVRRY